MLSVLTKEDPLCRWAAFSAGLAASRPFASRLFEGPWYASLGWFALGIVVLGATAVVWAALLSLWYERSSLPTKGKRALVLLVGPALPFVGLIVANLVSPASGDLSGAEILRTVGFGVGGSLAMSLLAWGAWRFTLMGERACARRRS
jgi:hypothetical protein